MITHQQILKDTDGNNIGVFIPMRDYEAIIEMLEDADDIRDFEKEKIKKETVIPLQEAIDQRKKGENKMNTKTWTEIKDNVYGEKGTERRDHLDRDFESFKIGLLLKKAREEKNMTQQQLAEIVDKKRTYISRVENNGSNLTLKTLYEIVEKGLGGKVNISIDV